MRHLLSTRDLSTDDVARLLDLTDRMAEINDRPVPKVPALRGTTVASLFFEDSTRTRLSFETAARRLSADTLTFSASTSSVNKGESIRDTVETLSAMGVHAFVVRHRSSGMAMRLTDWTDASVVNAGDGWHQHPTQALLDAYTITREFGGRADLTGRRVVIVGDVQHSRVARSNMDLLSRMGAHVIVVGPATLLPRESDGWNVEIRDDLDPVLRDVDVLYMLRMQRERMGGALVPDVAEYSKRYGLDSVRADMLPPHAIVMHPGPMNRGVEMLVDPNRLPGSRILSQVRNGVAVRMAVLFSLLGGGAMVPSQSGGDE